MQAIHFSLYILPLSATLDENATVRWEKKIYSLSYDLQKYNQIRKE